MRLSDQIAGLAVPVEGVSQLGVSVVEAAQPGVGGGEETVGASLCGRVGQPGGSSQGGSPNGGPFVPLAPAVEDVGEDPGQLPGMDVEPGGRGVVDSGRQHRTLSGEPGQGLLVVGEMFRGHPGLGCSEVDRLPARVQQPGTGVRGVQVVVKQPVDGDATLLVEVDAAGKVCGIGAQQVVEAVAAGGGLDDQVRLGQLGQQRPYLYQREAGEAGRRSSRDAGAGVQAEQPEQPRRRRGQRVIGPGEHRPYVGGRGIAGG
jgi:hypothetical protein